MCGRGPAWRHQCENGQDIEDGIENHKTEITNGRSPPRWRRKQPPGAPQGLEDSKGEEPAKETEQLRRQTQETGVTETK